MTERATLQDLVHLRAEKIATAKDPRLPYIGLEHIAQDCGEIIGSAPSSSSVSINNTFASGDILFGKLRPNLRKCVRAPFAGYCSTDLLVFRAEAPTDPGFAARMLQSEKVFAEALRTAEGTKMPRTSWSALQSLRVFHPPVRQQRRIAEVLDTVDDGIRSTEKLTAKLGQIKAGLLHDLMTRGITAEGNVRARATEHPDLYVQTAIGQVPEEWDVGLLDKFATRGSGHTPNKNVPSYWDGGIRWVSLADSDRLDNVWIRETDKEISELGVANSSAVKHADGTVILSRDAGVGKSAILVGTMAVSQHFMAWTCGSRLNNVYLYYWLQHAKPRFEAIAMGSTIKTIGLPFFRKLEIGVPSRREQDAIASHMLDCDGLIWKSKAELGKLRALKAGLMDDLLTGRVRVTVDEDAA